MEGNNILIPLDEYKALRAIAERARIAEVVINSQRYGIEAKHLVDTVKIILAGEVTD